jgi:hypothetical protein
MDGRWKDFVAIKIMEYKTKKRKIFNVCGEETKKHFNGFIVLKQNLQISKVQL